MRFRLFAGILAFLALPWSAAMGQSEAHLREHFEGRRVTVKIEMPATKDGLNIYPGSTPALRYDRLASELKRHGAALRPGDSTLVTKVKVKRDLIEFHLGGGGFGTAFDDSGTSVYVPVPSKSNREKDLEGDIKREKDPQKKKAMQRELDDLRRERERIEAQVRVLSEQAEEIKKERVRRQALEGGSRFNLRYPGGVPPSALTPEAVAAALVAFVDFEADTPAALPAQSSRRGNAAQLRKGMSWQQVVELLGEPASNAEQQEGRYAVLTAAFENDETRVETEFVEGVLVAFRISSR